MKENLLDVFVNYLLEELDSHRLGFKVSTISTVHNVSIFNYAICPIEDSISFDADFVKENLLAYYYSLNLNNRMIVPTIMHKLITNHSELLFKQLSILGPFFGNKRGMEDCFPALDYSFITNDMIHYLKNYNDKKLLSPTYYCFERLLDEISKRFKDHAEYKNILLHIFNIHSTLIKKTNGNLLATRSWCMKNLYNTTDFEPFYTIVYSEPLFVTVPYKTSLLFIDLKTIQARFLLNDAKGNERYHIFLKSFTHILNFTQIKKELNIEKVEGHFVFDKKTFQLTFFSHDQLNYAIIEKNITTLLDVLCQYSNSDSKNIEDFENQIYKAFQYHLLNDKLIPLKKQIKKVNKL